MNKLLAALGFALISFFSFNSVAADLKAPLVCNAAETAKVCRDYDPKKDFAYDGPTQEAKDKFQSALRACSPVEMDFSSQRYIACQDDPEISKLRDDANAKQQALQAKFDFLKRRCDPKYAPSRVCGTSADSQVTSAQLGAKSSNSEATPVLTMARDPNKKTPEQIADQKQRDADFKRKQDLAIDAAKSSAAKDAAISKAKDDERRAMCLKPENSSNCGCAKYLPPDPNRKNCTR